MTLRTPSIAISAILATAAAQAADRVEEVTVFGQRVPSVLVTTSSTASRLGITPLETPASIEIIEGELIRQRGDANIVEAITRATGLSNDASPGDGGTSMSTRGFVGHNSIMQTYDGARLFIGAGTVTFPFDSWTAKRIEVLRGAASVMYGQGAIGGVINVLPRKPTTAGTEGETLVGVGADGRLNAAVDFNQPINEQMAYRVDASYRQADNWVDRGDSDSLALSGSFLWQPSERLSITLAADYGDQTPMQYFGVPLRDGRIDESLRDFNYNVADADIHYEDLASRFGVRFDISDNVTLSNTAYYLDTDRRWYNLEEYYLDSATDTVERLFYLEILHHQQQQGDHFDATFRQSFGTSSNTVVVGFDWNQVDFQHVNNSPYGGSTTVPVYGFNPGRFINLAGTYPKFATDTEQYAVFFEDRFELNDQWSFSGGARYDHNEYERTSLLNGSKFGGELSDTTWRAGVVFQPVESTALYAQYATAVDAIGSIASLSQSQVELDLTTGRQIEVGLKQSLLGQRLEWTFAAFRIVKEDLLAEDRSTPDPTDVAQVGEQSSKGVEASVAYTIDERWRIDANATLLDAKYDENGADTGNVPNGVPKQLANMWASYQFLADWRARAGVRYVGKKYLDSGNTTVLPSYSIVDAALDWSATDALTVGAHVRNATDKTYALAAYGGAQIILGMPRTWELEARYKF
jgi:iron complex outermembrane recepter protein